MLSVTALRELIPARIGVLPPRAKPLAEARGVVLAEEALSDSDLPSGDLSAMDGYAVREEACTGSYRLAGTILPGKAAAETPAPGCAIAVFTGSALPSGVKVVMQEDVTAEGEMIRINTMERAGHVRRRGAIARKGDLVLPCGTILSPADLGILAGIGITHPRVIPRPRVAHLTTGNEVVSPESFPEAGQIRNTNAPLVRALVEEIGGIVTTHRHCDESMEAGLSICNSRDFRETDLLVISGGASVGKHDRTAAILEALGFELICRKVSMRPGKPFLLGVNGHRVAVGLPGNPVSHFVTFHLFVRRVMECLSGRPLSKPISGRISDPGGILREGALETWWPAVWSMTTEGNDLSPLPWLHSGHLTALHGANALIRIPASDVPRHGQNVEFLSCGNPVITIP